MNNNSTLRSCLLTLIIAVATSIAAAQVQVEITDGVSQGALKNKIEKKASSFLKEIYDAYNNDRALKLSGLVLPSAEQSIEMLWENVHFRPEDQYIEEILLNSADGYQIRNIPLIIKPQDAGAETDYKEAVINFDRKGNITSVFFSIESNTYRRIMEKGVELDDMARRLEILDYVERFRTSYNQKDINFLNQVFSDDALIITGKVVTARKLDGAISLPTLKYTKQSKAEYINKLRAIFRNNRYINVKFDDVIIKRHAANPNVYGVRVVQQWSTSSYSDEGYVYMIWDFSNPNAPQIHVRTWQPKYIDAAQKQPLPEDEIFDLNSFDGL